MKIPREQITAGLIVLLALGVGTAVNKRLPDPASIRQQPFMRTSSRGTAVDLRSGRVNVLDVTAAPMLQGLTTYPAIAPKEGIFLVLEVEYLRRRQPGTLASIAIQSKDGRLFGGSPPLGAHSCGVAQPGVPIRCQVIVEMARDALVGAKALLTEDPVKQGQGDDVALVDLGISEAVARELQGQKKPIKILPLTRIQER